MKKSFTLFFLALGLLLIFGAQPAMTNVSENGESLVSERCSQCHGLGRVQRAVKDQSGWEKTVDRMIGKSSGLLNNEERKAVIDYLSNSQ